ncbi:MAG: OmpA family protein, partial [Pseudomonadota bacterium]
AMMAFFLLMWLLGATTEDQRKGIADYFNTTIPIAATSGGGTDALNGDSILTAKKRARSEDYQDPYNREAKPKREQLEEEIKELAERAGLIDADGRVQVRITEDGTVIELVDAAGSALFQSGSASASRDLRILLLSAADAVKRSGSAVAISGHTDSLAFASDSYTNWELSADRANTARRLLIDAGVPAGRIVEVSGRADREPISDNPLDPVNRRISIILKDGEGPLGS